MSLYINSEIVRRVLLIDGWHDCEFDDGISSFFLDAYEYTESAKPNAHITLKGGMESTISATGFCFEDRDTHKTIFGPLTSVLAVSY